MISRKSFNPKKLNFDKEGVLLTIPPLRKKKKMVNIETENTKKEKEEILNQKEINSKIEELENKIKLELNQYNIVIAQKREELSQTEKRVKQINERNESLNKALEKIEQDFELKKYKNKDKINDNVKKENPEEIKIKENSHIIDNTRKTMEQYQQEINKLENAFHNDENIKIINNLKFEIKTIKERITNLEKEKKYLLLITEEHNKCLEDQNKIKNEIDYFNTELNKLKLENNLKTKEKQEKYKNDIIVKNKNMNKINEALLSPHEIEIKKEKKMKKTLEDYWELNKEKLLKYSLSDNNMSININTINNLNKKNINTKQALKTDNITNNNNDIKLNKIKLYSKKKNYSKNLTNLNLDLNIDEEKKLFLFNSETKKILSKILPLSEIEKYEKRYECADLEKKNLLKKFSLENKIILREQKNMKNKIEKNNQKLKLNEVKNNELNIQLDLKEKEYEKLKNNLNNMKKELEDKKLKIKIWEEENILMSQKYQGIRDKYIEKNDKDVDLEEVEEDEDEND